MSATLVIERMDELLGALPGGQIVGMYDLEGGELLVERRHAEAPERLAAALSSAAVTQAKLANIHMDFDTGIPSRFSYDDGEHYVCAVTVEGRYLLVAIGKDSGTTGLALALVDARITTLHDALTAALAAL